MRFFSAALRELIANHHEGRQRALAQRAHLQPGTVSKYVRGVEFPQPENLGLILQAYPEERVDLLQAALQDVLDQAGATDLRAKVTGSGKPPKSDPAVEGLVARVDDRLRRDRKFRQIVEQMIELG